MREPSYKENYDAIAELKAEVKEKLNLSDARSGAVDSSYVVKAKLNQLDRVVASFPFYDYDSRVVARQLSEELVQLINKV